MKNKSERDLSLTMKSYICQDANYSKECNDTPWVEDVWVDIDGKCWPPDAYGAYSRESVNEVMGIIRRMMSE